MERALRLLRRVLTVSLEAAAPPVGLGIVFLFTTWTIEADETIIVSIIRLSALAIVFGLVVSHQNGSRVEGSLIRRYAIVVPQAYFAAVVWALPVDHAFIATRELEINDAVQQNWPGFPLWSDSAWASTTSRPVTDWMNEGIRLVCFFPILWWTRRYPTTKQSSAWIWSSIAWAGCLLPIASIIAWNYPGDEVTGDGFWAAPLVIGGGVVIGVFFVTMGTVVSFALGRNPYVRMTDEPQPSRMESDDSGRHEG